MRDSVMDKQPTERAMEADLSPTKSANTPITNCEDIPIKMINPFLSNDSTTNYTVPKLQVDDNATVNRSVARLSISEVPVVEVENFKAKRMTNTGKRRRSSAAISAPGSTLRLSSHSDELIADRIKNKGKKKKKRAQKHDGPLSIKVGTEKLASINAMTGLIKYLYDITDEHRWWEEITGKNSLKKNVLLFIPGLEPQDFGLPQDQRFADNVDELATKGLTGLNPFDNQITFPMSAPGSNTAIFSAYNAFINPPLLPKQRRELLSDLSKKTITIYDLLASVDQLLERDYPIHEGTKSLTDIFKSQVIDINNEVNSKATWKNTKEFEHDGSHIFALDCEMCKCETGFIVARVSLVNFENEVIYDELVIPEAPIVDYVTKYSGMTKEKLDGATKTVEQVQDDLLNIISANDILIGHSLSNDLSVLRIRHPNIVDTAIIYDHQGGPPFKPSLKYLASEYLNKDIQAENGDDGHDSIEDARTCMELTKLKIQRGMAFGSHLRTENIFDLLDARGIKSLVLNNTVPKSHFKTDSNIGTIFCDNDDEVFNSIINNIEQYDFFVGRLRALEFARGYAIPKNGVVLKQEDVLKNICEQINNIYEKVPSGSLITILSGSGNTKQWMALMNKINTCNSKEERKQLRKDLNEELKDTIKIARDAVVEIIIKS